MNEFTNVTPNSGTQVNAPIEPLRTIEIDGFHITILGTAHVSKVSAEMVQTLIATKKYDAIAVELCESRHNAIINPELIAKMDLFQVIKHGQASMVAASLALGAFQQRMAEQHGIEPGAEMRVAIKDATDAGLPVLLIDREIGTTLKRIYRNVPWWKRFSIFGGLIASIISQEKVSTEEIERLKEGDVLESTFSQFSENEKDLFKSLISERDEYMSAHLIKTSQEKKYQHILAIVGAGHLKGITQIIETKAIKNPNETISQLDAIPDPSNWLKYFPWIIVLLVLTGFVIGFTRSPELGTAMLIDWVLINGGLSALGAAIAFAHPLTVITAFFAAPLTSLNPTIGAGMVVAAMETFLRKPKVRDFNRLRNDAAHLKGWWHNQVTRILLIFLLSTLGSAIGTYIAGFRIYDRLSGG